MWPSPFVDSNCIGAIDTSIVLTHMMLEATELGIGSCWVKLFAPEKAAEAFDLPENIKVVSLMPIGYPAENAHPARLHTSIRPVEELVKYI